MTASMTPDDIPFAVRKAVEQEALMTVRMEPTKTMFIPSNTRMTAMPPMIFPDYTTYTYHNMNGHVQLVSESSSGSMTTYENWTYDDDRTVTNNRSSNAKTVSSKSNKSSWSKKSKNSKSTTRKVSHSNKSSKKKNQKKQKSGCDIDCPFFKLLVPPCWFQ